MSPVEGSFDPQRGRGPQVKNDAQTSCSRGAIEVDIIQRLSMYLFVNHMLERQLDVESTFMTAFWLMCSNTKDKIKNFPLQKPW